MGPQTLDSGGTQSAESTVGNGVQTGKGEGPGDRPARSRTGPRPAGCRHRGRGSPKLAPGRAGRGSARGRGGVRSRGTAAGEASGVGATLTWAARRRKAAASRASAAAAAMSPGPRHRRRQMSPSNAPAQSAAQAPCVFRACARGRVQRAQWRRLRIATRRDKMAVSVQRGWWGWRGSPGWWGWRG